MQFKGARFTIEIRAHSMVINQMQRSGFQVVQEGSVLGVEVPNRILLSDQYTVTCEVWDEPSRPATHGYPDY
jgi:hypothetical protein